MSEYTFTFFALTDSIGFKVASPDEEVEKFVFDFLTVFSEVDFENKKMKVATQLRKNDELTAKLDAFVQQYKTQFPELNALSAYFRKLKGDEDFFFLPNYQLNQENRLKLHNFLKATQENLNFEDVQIEFDKLFKETLNKYMVNVFGPIPIRVGVRMKKNRICRFCQNQNKPTSFKSKAHAIPEGLGNKTILCNEECDICNGKFSKTIEPDIINYLSLFRTIFEINGKGGTKKMEGSNFKMMTNEQIEIYFDENITPLNESKLSLLLKTRERVSRQNIYKALCKFFIGVIDKKYLLHFTNTIRWINGELEIKNLPKVAEMISYHSFDKQPKLATYLRKDEDTDLPFAVGEFYFTCTVMVFVVPLSSKDKKDFTDPDEYEFFWKHFKHLDKSKSWSFTDLSKVDRMPFEIRLNFEVEKNPES